MALGKEKLIYDADERLPRGLSKDGFDSICAIGKNIPENEEIFNEIKAPTGKHKQYSKHEKCSLLYNEYVVYNTNQIQIKYIAKGTSVNIHITEVLYSTQQSPLQMLKLISREGNTHNTLLRL